MCMKVVWGCSLGYNTSLNCYAFKEQFVNLMRRAIHYGFMFLWIVVCELSYIGNESLEIFHLTGNSLININNISVIYKSKNNGRILNNRDLW